MEAHGYLDREEVNARLIAFARKLDELYGATVAGKVSKAGNYQIITLTITHVDTTSDLRYARVYVSA